MALGVQHGHWGELFLNATKVVEVTAIEYTSEIERIEVPQVGTRMTEFQEGLITSQGELRIHKVFSDFESAFFEYLLKTPDQLRAARDSGVDVRPAATLKVSLNDPRGRKFGEYETLTGVLFWTYTGGFDITALTGRVWPFTFTGIIAGDRILRNGQRNIY